MMMPENERSRLSANDQERLLIPEFPNLPDLPELPELEYCGRLSGEEVKYESRQIIDYNTPPVEPEPYCGAYWIITTCLTGIALGLGFGALLWLVLG